MTVPTAAETTEDEFVALVLADEQLLQLEFDAIVSAQWADPPPDDPGDAVGSQPFRPRTTESGAVRTPARPQHPGVGGWARQRSPPV